MGTSKNRTRAQELLGSLRRGDIDCLGTEGIRGLPAQVLGALGEELAAWYLEDRGYHIIERNYRCPEGEADIVAFDEETSEIVLVEVKTRRSHCGGDDPYPEEAVTRRKRQRYRRIAYCYAADNYPAVSIRFDVIAVSLDTTRCGDECEIRHLCRAFDWEAGR